MELRSERGKEVWRGRSVWSIIDAGMGNGRLEDVICYRAGDVTGGLSLK